MVRLSKFFSLVHNEYIKIFKKKSMIIMLVLAVIACFGFSFIMKMSTSAISFGEETENEILNGYKSQIEYLKESKEDGWEEQVQAYQMLYDNKLTKLWQRESVNFLVYLQDKTIYDKALEAIKSGDSIALCEVVKDVEGLPDGFAWEFSYRAENKIPLAENVIQGTNKINTIIGKIKSNKNDLMLLDEKSAKAKEYEDSIKIGLYQLDKKIYTNLNPSSLADDETEGFDSSEMDFWSVFTNTAGLVSLAGLFLIIIAGGTIASEFSNGTIKFLLINPAKRWKILMSKYFACMTTGLFFVLLFYVVSIPAVGIFNGFDLSAGSYIYVENGVVKEMSPFLYMAKKYLLSSADIIVYGTMAFAISSLARNSALAIGTSVFAMFVGSTITNILSQLKQDWGRYLIFCNVDLNGIIQGDSLFAGQTITFALCVIAVHMVVFILTAWDAFTKKSV